MTPAFNPGGSSGVHMGGAPRTTVQRTVPRIVSAWVVFPPLADRHLRAGDRLDPARLAALDARWEALGLVGATSVQSIAAETFVIGRGLERDDVVCEDDDLNANVRLRLRGSLLLFDMPLLDSSAELVGGAQGLRGASRRIHAAGLLCGDERLHAVVTATAHRPLGEVLARRASTGPADAVDTHLGPHGSFVDPSITICG